MTTTLFIPRGRSPRVPLLAALLAVACASSEPARRPSAAVAPGPQSAPPPRPAAPERAAPENAATPVAPADGAAVSPRAQRLFEEAVATPPDWEVRERRFRSVLEAQELPEAWHNLGVALERQGKATEARSAYERALALRSSFAEPAVNLAMLGEPADDPQAAAATYAALVKKYPDDAPARVRLASLYHATGQLDEAWRLARGALMRDPKAAGAYKVMMRVALERGNADLAELIALRAQKIAPGDPELTTFVGAILARRGDAAAAAALYRKALSQKADFLPARRELLRQALEARSWEGVVEQGKTIAKADPGDARVHLCLGVAYRYLGKPDEALAEYDKAESLSGGKLPEVHLDRGLLLMKVKNRCEPAIDEFRRYQGLAGPAAVASSPAPRLQRECEQIVLATRQAEEASRQEAEKKRAAPPEPAKPAAPEGGK